MKTIFCIVLLFATLAFKNGAAQFTLSCDSFCVLNIEMDTSGALAVTIYNYNNGHVNYPTIQVLDANGDTLAADTMLTFFAHMENAQQTYLVPTVLDSVPVGFTATVLLSEGIWDTLCVLSYPCDQLDAVVALNELNVSVFPVPATDVVNVRLDEAGGMLFLFDGLGRRVLQRKHTSFSQSINVSELPRGFYLLQVVGRDGAAASRMISISR